jgi:hypothetical protein
MTELFDIATLDLEKLSIENYFKTLEFSLSRRMSVDKLTMLFTREPFWETRPYLTRRHLKPLDTRFTQIELVYEHRNVVAAIAWDLEILLAQLTSIFGEPMIKHVPYDNSTDFAFRSENPNIEIIKTTHLGLLTKVKNKDVFKYQDETGREIELSNPKFTFIQFNLTS